MRGAWLAWPRVGSSSSVALSVPTSTCICCAPTSPILRNETKSEPGKRGWRRRDEARGYEGASRRGPTRLTALLSQPSARPTLAPAASVERANKSR